MQIVTSRFASNDLQIDGRRTVLEEHVDDEGNFYYFNYMSDKNLDLGLRLSERAQELNDEFQFNEEHADDLVQSEVDLVQQKISDLQDSLDAVSAKLDDGDPVQKQIDNLKLSLSDVSLKMDDVAVVDEAATLEVNP